jgi:uncharacterized protein (TIGR00251 family)
VTELVRAHTEGAVVAVRAAPGSSTAGVVGRHGDELRVRLCSPPVDGRANSELCAVLATALRVRSREVSVIAGHSSRSKQVLVARPFDEVVQRLQAWIGPNQPAGG